MYKPRYLKFTKCLATSCDHVDKYLRRDYFLPTNKLCIRNSLAVTFEDHDGLLSVPKIIIVDTVIWGRKGGRIMKYEKTPRKAVSSHHSIIHTPEYAHKSGA